MWDVDTEDWKKDLNASKVIASVERYRNQDWDGAVILMHDIHPTTVEACKTLIPELVNAGYQLVTVSELAYLKGVKLEPGKSYWGIGEKSTETDYEAWLFCVQPLRSHGDKKKKSPLKTFRTARCFQWGFL